MRLCVGCGRGPESDSGEGTVACEAAPEVNRVSPRDSQARQG